MGRPWGPCPQAWCGAGAGWPGKDIDEDLTGSIPQLSVGVDAPEQRLPQGLGRVGPQLPPGSGQRQHSSADGLLLWDPVGMGARVRVCTVPCTYPPWAMHTPCRESPGFQGGPHRDALCAHSTPLRNGWAMSGSEGPLPAQGAQVGAASAFMDLSPQGAQKGWLGQGLGWSRVCT